MESGEPWVFGGGMLILVVDLELTHWTPQTYVIKSIVSHGT